MFSITTKFGRFELTEFGQCDSGEWNGCEAGSQEFFEDAHNVFDKWAASGMTQAEYFGEPYFIIDADKEQEIINNV